MSCFPLISPPHEDFSVSQVTLASSTVQGSSAGEKSFCLRLSWPSQQLISLDGEDTAASLSNFLFHKTCIDFAANVTCNLYASACLIIQRFVRCSAAIPTRTHFHVACQSRTHTHRSYDVLCCYFIIQTDPHWFSQMNWKG